MQRRIKLLSNDRLFDFQCMKSIQTMNFVEKQKIEAIRSKQRLLYFEFSNGLKQFTNFIFVRNRKTILFIKFIPQIGKSHLLAG